MRTAMLVAAALISVVASGSARALDPYAGVDPYWILLHEPAVVAELKLSGTQRPSYQKLIDRLDGRFFPCRNQPEQDARREMTSILEEARQELQTLLTAPQRQRLSEILRWRVGSAALLEEDFAARMRYTAVQRQRITEILADTEKAVAALEQQSREGVARDRLEKEYDDLKKDEQSRLFKLLKPDQRKTWKELLGPPFDVAKLGQPAFKAPELVDTGDWINSPPVSLAKLRGKVVVVHFYASGCINCIRNYPWYLEWDERYPDEDVVLIGIHTPETESERNPAQVREKAAAAKFGFPVLIDGRQENWNAWGNSMWPTVYLVDRRGYLRAYWPGELKWQGNDGEKSMREQIEKLRAEPAR